MWNGKTTYQVNEIFNSVQGEGWQAGRLATFIRLQGCTVGCPWCDTKYTWKAGGTRMTVDEIVNQVAWDWVVITGGEPTMYNLDDLIGALRAQGRGVQLETSGQYNLKGLLVPDWITWSPKANLGFECQLKIVHEVKIVVDEKLEWETVEDLAGKYYNCKWSLMPEGCPPSQESIDKAYGFLSRVGSHHELKAWISRWKFSDRLQWRMGVK